MTTRVTFKHETEIDGQATGPVTVYDVETYENDPVLAERRAKNLPGIPFGHEPAGMTKLGWKSHTEAKAIAEANNVPLEET